MVNKLYFYCLALFVAPTFSAFGQTQPSQDENGYYLFFIFHLHSPHIYGILILACGRNTSHNIIWLHGQAVKTLASHAGIRGSIPLGVTFKTRNF